MKTLSFIPCLLLACLPAANAALVLTDNAAVDIPDGSSSGLARLLTVTGTSQTIVSVVVSVEINAKVGEDAFLGDLYAYLTNGTETAVLLNRPGRTSTAPAGYGDNQPLNVTFSDAATDDVHNYRFTLSGNNTTPLIAPLSGTWLPDGRTTDPANVLGSDAPTARLNGFTGKAADGNWTLFVADMSGGGQHVLSSWTITLNTVPEPSALLLTLGAVPMLLRRRR